jgi:hypothetical protein
LLGKINVPTILIFPKWQNLEICAIQLETKTANLIMLHLYRAPSGGVKKLGMTLKYAYNPKCEFIVCGGHEHEIIQKNR